MDGEIEESGKLLSRGKEMEKTLVPKGEQRIEGGEEGKNHNAGARARMELLAKHAVRPAELT